MALDVRKRQQKLAKKAAKRKAVVATKKSLGEAGGLCPMRGTSCLMPVHRSMNV